METPVFSDADIAAAGNDLKQAETDADRAFEKGIQEAEEKLREEKQKLREIMERTKKRVKENYENRIRRAGEEFQNQMYKSSLESHRESDLEGKLLLTRPKLLTENNKTFKLVENNNADAGFMLFMGRDSDKHKLGLDACYSFSQKHNCMYYDTFPRRAYDSTDRNPCYKHFYKLEDTLFLDLERSLNIPFCREESGFNGSRTGAKDIKRWSKVEKNKFHKVQYYREYDDLLAPLLSHKVLSFVESLRDYMESIVLDKFKNESEIEKIPVLASNEFVETEIKKYLQKRNQSVVTVLTELNSCIGHLNGYMELHGSDNVDFENRKLESNIVLNRTSASGKHETALKMESNKDSSNFFSIDFKNEFSFNFENPGTPEYGYKTTLRQFKCSGKRNGVAFRNYDVASI